MSTWDDSGDTAEPPVPAAVPALDLVPEAQPALAGVTDEPAADPNTSGVAERLRLIDRAVTEIHRELHDANELAAGRQRVIDRLHEENQRLRSGERQLLLRPVITDLYRLRDDLVRQAANLPDGITPPQAAALLESFAHSVEVALERCGVHVVRPDVGELFDPHRHRAAGVTEVTAADQDGRICEPVSDGYVDTIDGRTLRPAGVRVARWTEPPELSSDSVD